LQVTPDSKALFVFHIGRGIKLSILIPRRIYD
jgi:hypothetical protein